MDFKVFKIVFELAVVSILCVVLDAQQHCPNRCGFGYECALVRHGRGAPVYDCISEAESALLREASFGAPTGPGSGVVQPDPHPIHPIDPIIPPIRPYIGRRRVFGRLGPRRLPGIFPPVSPIGGGGILIPDALGDRRGLKLNINIANDNNNLHDHSGGGGVQVAGSATGTGVGPVLTPVGGPIGGTIGGPVGVPVGGPIGGPFGPVGVGSMGGIGSGLIEDPTRRRRVNVNVRNNNNNLHSHSGSGGVQVTDPSGGGAGCYPCASHMECPNYCTWNAACGHNTCL